MSSLDYTDSSVDEFLDRVRQLELKSTEEDLRRTQRLKDELLSSPTRSTIILPKPVARSSFNSMINSPSINDFNSHVSADYRLNMSDLAYQSAYNYDKSQQSSTSIPSRSSLSLPKSSYNSESRFSSSIPKDLPEVIKFDDFITTRTPNYRQPQPSRYSKFQVTDEQKRDIDQTIAGLIGELPSKNNDTEEDPPIPALTRDRKGGSLQPGWAPSIESKPKVPTPTATPFSQRSSCTNDLKKSPRRQNLHEISPIRKSHAELNINKLQENIEPPKPKFKPEIKPKPQLKSWLNPSTETDSLVKINDSTGSKINIQPSTRHSWMDSVKEKTTSTPQGLSTASKIHINKSNTQNKWLDSVREKSSSTSQGLSTDTNYRIEEKHTQNSWLDSAKRNTPSSRFSTETTSKIKIERSESSTLSSITAKREKMEIERNSTLKELNDAKLNHVVIDLTESPPKKKDDFNITPITLKKIRPSVPEKPTSISKPEFLNQKLSTVSQNNNEKRKVSEYEALKKSKSLKAPTQQRKISVDVPEALKKSKSLKPPVPKQKPTMQVPEALEKMGHLKPAKVRVVSEEKLPEGIKKLQSLKPSKPLRKPTPTELEAISQLKNIKNKNSNNSAPIVKPKSSRVTSQSKEILNSHLQRLKSIKEVSPSPSSVEKSDPQNDKSELMRTLNQQLLRKANTDTNLLKSNHSKSNVELHRAATFNGNEDGEKLQHITKQRSKGPKRRVPKSVK